MSPTSLAQGEVGVASVATQGSWDPSQLPGNGRQGAPTPAPRASVATLLICSSRRKGSAVAAVAVVAAAVVVDSL